MIRTAFLACVACGGVACGSSSAGSATAGKSYGETGLATLDATCTGVAGLTGQAILDQRADAIQTTLGYITAAGQQTASTALSMTITWPSQPVATCYPAYQENGTTITNVRVAIAGLTLHFATADGQLDETLAAKAWAISTNGSVQQPQLIAVTSRAGLHGTWKPFPDYDNGGHTLYLGTTLAGANSNLANGVFAMNNQPASELEAGIGRSGSAMATWPSSAP